MLQDCLFAITLDVRVVGSVLLKIHHGDKICFGESRTLDMNQTGVKVNPTGLSVNRIGMQ